MLEYLTIFVFAVLVEVLNVLWVHYSERGAAGKTMACTIVISLTHLYCLAQALRDNSKRIVFVAGLALGAYCTVRGKEWVKKRRPMWLKNKYITQT